MTTLKSALVSPHGLDKSALSSVKLPITSNYLLDDPRYNIIQKKNIKNKKNKI